MGSPSYGFILDRLARGEHGGVVGEILRRRPAGDDPFDAAIVLRLMACAHRLALTNVAPGLAAHYPSCASDGDVEKAWSALNATIAEHKETIRCELDVPPQTNEVGRAAALIGGFLLIAKRYGLPLRLLEISASAGLMLHWDRFRYETGTWSWGPVGRAVRLDDHLAGRMPFSSDLHVTICERAGCDVSPIDPAAKAGRLRFLRLAAACEIAQEFPVGIERAHAWPWIARELDVVRSGVTTVVFHTVMLQYLDSTERARLSVSLAEAGRRSTLEAPLAYLTLDPQPHRRANVLLRLWPDYQELELASASLHGRDVTRLHGG